MNIIAPQMETRKRINFSCLVENVLHITVVHFEKQF